MKHYVYVLCLMLTVVGIDSCKKGDDPVPDPVVGIWKLDRIRTGGFVAPFSTIYPNGDNDPVALDFQQSFTIKSDKTYSGTTRTAGRVFDQNGNWEFSNNTLMLKDDKGNSNEFTFDGIKTPAQLLGKVIAQSDTLTNPVTRKGELVKYTVQNVYVKQ